MDIAILGDEENDIVFFTDLHGYWEVILCFCRKEHVDCSLLEWLIASWRLTDFNHMELEEKKSVSVKA